MNILSVYLTNCQDMKLYYKRKAWKGNEKVI